MSNPIIEITDKLSFDMCLESLQEQCDENIKLIKRNCELELKVMRLETQLVKTRIDNTMANIDKIIGDNNEQD